MAHFLDKLFGDPNSKALKRLQVEVEQINQLEPELEKLEDNQLKERAQALHERVLGELKYNLKEQLPDLTYKLYQKEQKILDSVKIEAFALTREAAKRVLGERPFDVQLMAGLALHEGKVAEQKTGEGKTLSATLPIFLNALTGRGAHVITVNDYLAKRDAGWMGQIYDFLGLSVGCLAHQTSYKFSTEAFEEENESEAPANEDPTDENNPTLNLVPISRPEAYRLDITYGTNSEFGFDYLRDNMAPAKKFLRQRDLVYCIIDEVDSILIDEARTPLIISAPAEESGDLYTKFSQLVPRLAGEDFTVDEKERAVRLKDSGMKKMQDWLEVESLYEDENVLLVHHLEEALKAEYLFKKDKDYVVRNDEVMIVDEFTGRMMPGRRYSEGLHQAIEAKEGVLVQRESDTLATISIQNYFRLYYKMSGMTGTAKTEEEEFIKIYNMEVVAVPTNRPVIRSDQSDKIYLNEQAKFRAIIEEIKTRREQGQPMLIGTISVEKNELFSKLLKKAKIPHEILNAKNHKKEAGIIANAGRPRAVTLATNMAGRGTNIVLGGAPPEQADKKKYREWEDSRTAAIEAGGLLVIGTERHESRRIDNQMRGRSGRQGEPGESIFYVSMDDDLMRIFGGEKLQGLMQRTNMPEDVPIQNNLVSRSIEQAQKRVEGHNFDIRRHVLKYDDVMNKHREALYRRRKAVMMAGGDEGKDSDDKLSQELKGRVKNIIHNQADNITRRFTVGDKTEWDTKELIKEISKFAPISKEDLVGLKEAVQNADDSEEAAKIVATGIVERYLKLEAEHGEEDQRQLERAVMLRTIDSLWVEHLNVMNDLRQGVGLQAVAQKDPLVVYQQEGYERFQLLMSSIDYEASRRLLHLRKVDAAQAQAQAAAATQNKRLILQGASEADTSGSAGLATINQSAQQQAAAQSLAAAAAASGQNTADSAISTQSSAATNNNSNNDVDITVRKVSDKLAYEGRRGSDQSSIKNEIGKKVGRNDPCPCGKINPATGDVFKYKKCCGK